MSTWRTGGGLRRQAMVYLALGGVAALLNLAFVMGNGNLLSHRVEQWAAFLTMGTFIAGVVLIWLTGNFSRSLAGRIANAGIGFLILGFLFRIMHWPWAAQLLVLGFAVFVVCYAIHFLLKPDKRIGDIIRLVAMTVTCVMMPLGILHMLPMYMAYWASNGLIMLAMVAYVLEDRPSAGTAQGESAEVASARMHAPELFEEDADK